MKQITVLRSVLIAAALVAAAPTAQARSGQHDQVYSVEKGARLVVEHTVGSLVVVAWDRDEISVEADYDTDEFELDVRDRGLRFAVTLAAVRGLSGYADLALRVPVWMPVEVRGHQVDVEIEGVEAPIEVDLVGGDVFVSGGRDEVQVDTVHGGIEIHDAVAELDLSSTQEDIELRDCRGEVRIESVNGDVRMEGIESGHLDVVTTNGDILIDGTLASAGDYHLSTHSGDVAISIPPDADMTIEVETFQGDVRSTFDATLEEIRKGRRYRMVLGNGQGRMDVTSFQGDVTLYDPKTGRRKRG